MLIWFSDGLSLVLNGHVLASEQNKQRGLKQELGTQFSFIKVSNKLEQKSQKSDLKMVSANKARKKPYLVVTQYVIIDQCS